MGSQVIAEERVQLLNDKEAANGQYVLYWMQASQRALDNHALEFAVRRANELEAPLLVAFGLTDNYPEANLRHYTFMVEGLVETAEQLKRRKIGFVLRFGSPQEVAAKLAQDACEVVCDRGYLRHQRQWRDHVAKKSPCKVWQVESDVIVPIETTSGKAEYAARTIRGKINKAADNFYEELRTTSLDQDSTNLSVAGEKHDSVEAVLSQLKLDESVGSVSHHFKGGTNEATTLLKRFVDGKLKVYNSDRTNVPDPPVSYLSPYLHFGQISPLTIALAVREKKTSAEDRDSFLEELLVRRELAQNFCYYTSNYDSFQCIPDWAKKSLEKHRDDERPHRYTASELEAAETHDSAWNAAMTEMKLRGYLHNHMRMYWGKKILEWSNTPEYAHKVALELNNKYFLDGRDANSFTNVAWIFGIHDRAFGERDIFGKVRYMAASGLKRKFDIDKYIRQVERLQRKEQSDD